MESPIQDTGIALGGDTRPPVNLRSISIGLLAVVLICAFTPYNDWVLNNTYFVGTYLPVGLLLFMVALIVLVNGPLRRWRRGAELSGGELAVVLGMGLVSCALPGSGLMRYLAPGLVAPYFYSAQNWDLAQLLRELDLPQWMFPTMDSADVIQRANDPVVQNFIRRAPAEGDGFLDRLRVVPYSAWVTPAITWGLLLAAVYGAVICLSVIVRRQWVENERLTFPLATIYLALIEPPEKPNALNSLFRSRAFWVAVAIPIFIHGINGLHQYYRSFWPPITIHLDMQQLFKGTIWSSTDWGFQSSRVYFLVIGATYFIQTELAFSLWVGFVLLQLLRLAWVAMYNDGISAAVLTDQQWGSVVMIGLFVLWIGRRQWALVGRQMFRRPRPDEGVGTYLPYCVAGWGFLVCCGGVAVWLLAAGATPAGAVVIVALLMLMLLVAMRVAAETGLVFLQIRVPFARPWELALTELPAAIAARTTLRNHFLTGLMGLVFTHDLREALPVYSTHAMRVADEAAYSRDRHWRRGIRFTGCLVLALVVGYGVAGASALYVEYTHGFTLDDTHASPVNAVIVRDSITQVTMTPVLQYRPPGEGTIDAHNRTAHFAAGFGVTALLAGLRLQFVGWPLHPLGFLMAYSYPMRAFWFSIFVGWILKVLVVRFGGAGLYRLARPFFIGLIIGEAMAAGIWIFVSCIQAMRGLDYPLIRLLPS